MQVHSINNIIGFKRRPTKEEEPFLQQVCNKAFDAMGATDRVVITHGSCFPAVGRNTLIGSPFGNAAKEYTKFLALYGFNANQLGPCGELEVTSKGIKHSPYNSSAFAKNRMFIDLEDLTTEKYGKILSNQTYEKITKEITNNNMDYELVDFQEANLIYNEALDESYNKYKMNLAKGQPQAIEFKKEFDLFLLKNNKRLTDEGIFKVLSKHYGTDEFELWSNSLDENLSVEVKNKNTKAINRYKLIENRNKKEIEKYKFEQFIITKQMKENQKWRENNGFKYINDFLVGCSNMDYWRCKDAFVEGYQLGAPEYGRNPQTWNIPVLNPRKLFIDTEMNLGPAGQFLKEKLDFALEFCENIRIDHAMGLIEPFVIENDSILYDEDGNVLNTQENPVNGHFMSEMYASDGEKLDNYKNYSCDHWHNNGNVTYYSNIMNKIVIPTLREHGINEKSAVWEDICSQPNVFTQIFYRNLNLPGLTQLEWSRAEFSPSDNWYLVGSHDSIPAQKMVKRDWTKNSEAWNHFYLAGYLHQDNFRAEERNEFCKKIEESDKERVKAKFAELMTTKKFQISFADLLGITDVTYNIGGSNRKDNWKARISSDFLEKYYEDLASDSPEAINIPEVLGIALKAKIDMKINESADKNKARAELHEKYQPLLDELEYFAEVLKS